MLNKNYLTINFFFSICIINLLKVISKNDDSILNRTSPIDNSNTEILNEKRKKELKYFNRYGKEIKFSYHYIKNEMYSILEINKK